MQNFRLRDRASWQPLFLATGSGSLAECNASIKILTAYKKDVFSCQ